VPMQSGPMQSGPMQSVSMQSVPMQSVPIQSGPMQSVPMQSGSMQSVPIQSGSMQSGSMQSVPMQSVSMQSVPMQSVSMQSVPPLFKINEENSLNKIESVVNSVIDKRAEELRSNKDVLKDTDDMEKIEKKKEEEIINEVELAKKRLENKKGGSILFQKLDAKIDKNTDLCKDSINKQIKLN